MRSNLHYLLDHVDGADDLFVLRDGTLRTCMGPGGGTEVMIIGAGDTRAHLVLSYIDRDGCLSLEHRETYINDLRDWIRSRTTYMVRPNG